MSEKSIPSHQLARIGERNRLTIIIGFKYILREPKNKKPHLVLKAIVQCECGFEMINQPSIISKSCKKCYHEKLESAFMSKHGLSDTPEHNSWSDAKVRCYNPNDKAYPNYGGRGITVCDRWMEPSPQGFLNFLADMGEKPEPKHLYSIDRINNDLGYFRENCRWADRETQLKNRRPLSEFKTVEKICEFCNVTFTTVWTKKKFCSDYCRSRSWWINNCKVKYPQGESD